MKDREAIFATGPRVFAWLIAGVREDDCEEELIQVSTCMQLKLVRTLRGIKDHETLRISYDIRQCPDISRVPKWIQFGPARPQVAFVLFVWMR
jgi:hypothetical protein